MQTGRQIFFLIPTLCKPSAQEWFAHIHVHESVVKPKQSALQRLACSEYIERLPYCGECSEVYRLILRVRRACRFQNVAAAQTKANAEHMVLVLKSLPDKIVNFMHRFRIPEVKQPYS